MGTKIAALAGGVGGAKLAHGLALALPPQDLTVIVNTGDDFTHLGLNISPDLDTVCYTLAGLANPLTGWGRAAESWTVMQAFTALGGPDWFNLGDRDLATHLERTRRRALGQPLSRITRDFCAAWGVAVQVLPMSDDPLPTIVHTDAGDLAFQEYFVQRRCQPRVQGFTFAGCQQAAPAPGVLEAIDQASAVIVCPSNPWVSIGPIMAVPGIAEALRRKPLLVVSPIVAGQAIKGPAAKMYAELGITPSAHAVALHYQNRLGMRIGMMIDEQDQPLADAIGALGLPVWTAQTVMQCDADRRALAEAALHACAQLIEAAQR